MEQEIFDYIKSFANNYFGSIGESIISSSVPVSAEILNNKYILYCNRPQHLIVDNLFFIIIQNQLKDKFDLLLCIGMPNDSFPAVKIC